MDASERAIIDLNIRHFRQLLKTETDPAKRRTIATLVAKKKPSWLAWTAGKAARPAAPDEAYVLSGRPPTLRGADAMRLLSRREPC
jgi:hypothetical protein